MCFNVIVVSGHYNGLSTLLKQTCAAQEAQEPACQDPTL